MINKKIIFITVVLCLCCLGVICFSESNFITIANGGKFNDSNAIGGFNTTTLGQALIFAQKTESVIAKSGFESILMVSKSGDISFTNETEQKVFETNVVPIKIKIKTERGTLSPKIAYKVGDGENPDFNKIEATECDIPSGQTEYTFEKDINFTEGLSTNQFWLWAQYIDSNNNTASSYIIITVNTQGGSSSKVVLESPDPFTKLSTTDPIIQTSKFSINVSTATISLWKGDSDTPIEDDILYTVDVTSNSRVFVSSTSCISYLNSTVMKDGKKLESGKTYTLKIDFASTTYEDIQLTFKALSGGVADILTYPSPFNPKKEKIKIRYLLAKTSDVTIRLYDKAGKVVCKLIDGEERSAGTHEEEWDGRNYAGETLATGAYIVEIIAGSDRRYTALAIVGK